MLIIKVKNTYYDLSGKFFRMYLTIDYIKVKIQPVLWIALHLKIQVIHFLPFILGETKKGIHIMTKSVQIYLQRIFCPTPCTTFCPTFYYIAISPS